MLRKTLRESGRARMANTCWGGRSIFAASRIVQKKPSFACESTCTPGVENDARTAGQSRHEGGPTMSPSGLQLSPRVEARQLCAFHILIKPSQPESR